MLKKIYCSFRKCESGSECVRYYKNAPWNVLITQRHYKPDKKGNCEGILKDWSEDIEGN